MTMTLISQLGEKRIISEIIRPLFNPSGLKAGIGDDCALIQVPDGHSVVMSTDRIPSNLFAFKHGIIDFYGLGYYLATLNLSDIAAAGGTPVGVLLNFGLPDDFLVDDLRKLMAGAATCVEQNGGKILGGDLSWASEISLSATSIGLVPGQRMVTRSDAMPGDVVFTSRQPGLTPAAFSVFSGKANDTLFDDAETAVLKGQFCLSPETTLGQTLGSSTYRATCMDNTDGIGQSLSEISQLSGVKIVITPSTFSAHPIVSKVAATLHMDEIDLILGAGADFGLVGTIEESAYLQLSVKFQLTRLGYVESGTGLYLKSNNTFIPYSPSGWNYFNNDIK